MKGFADQEVVGPTMKEVKDILLMTKFNAADCATLFAQLQARASNGKHAFTTHSRHITHTHTHTHTHTQRFPRPGCVRGGCGRPCSAEQGRACG
jgi:hypothetical protein